VPGRDDPRAAGPDQETVAPGADEETVARGADEETVPLGADGSAPTLLLDAPAEPEPIASAPTLPPVGVSPPAGDAPSRGVFAGRYRLASELGAGGMGRVVLAEDLFLGRRVAIKTLGRDVDHGEEQLARFRREVALAHAVSHPNIARTFDLGELDGESFLTMEYLEGETLEKRLVRDLRLTSAQVRELAIPLCLGLRAAHRAGVVHRDLKPANVMLVDGPRRVVLMDFGIAGWAAGATPASGAGEGGRYGARADVTSAGFGTPLFMAPEQWDGAEADPRTDLYALGVILFLCLTGRTPYGAGQIAELARLHREAPVPDPREHAPEIDAGLAHLVRRCLAKRPEERPQSVSEVLEQLEMPARRRRFALQMAGLGAIATLLLGGLGLWLTRSAELAVLGELRPALQTLAELVAAELDPDDLDRVRGTGDVDSEAFRRVAGVLVARSTQLEDEADIYVLRPGDRPGHYYVVCDPAPSEMAALGGSLRAGRALESLPGASYDGSAFPWMAEAMATGRAAAEPDFSHDVGGYVLSGYAVRATDAPDGPYLIGVDATHHRLTALARRIRLAVGGAWLAVLAALALVLHPRRQLRRAWRHAARGGRSVAAARPADVVKRSP